MADVSMTDQDRWTSCYRHWVFGGQRRRVSKACSRKKAQDNFSCARHLLLPLRCCWSLSHNSPSALRADVYRRPLQEHLNTAETV